jgi:hypothetical protein
VFPVKNNGDTKYNRKNRINEVVLVKIRQKYGTANKVGKTVIRLRKEHGWKQHELLARLQLRGIMFTQTTLSEIEGQTRQVKYEELKALSDIFSVPIDDLFESESDE